MTWSWNKPSHTKEQSRMAAIGKHMAWEKEWENARYCKESGIHYIDIYIYSKNRA